MYKLAFSLIELSIVLVVLGLLVGGVLTGRDLIKAAELRSVIKEVTYLQTSMYTFNEKYLAIPGDMKKATLFWGDNPIYCSDTTIADGVPGTCNGNGNGVVNDNSAGPNQKGESFMFWQHLSNAGIIEGSYTGLSGPESKFDTIAGTNVLASKYGSGCWGVDDEAGSSTYFDIPNIENILEIGTDGTLVGDGQDCDAALFTPEEAWNIDAKTDDGKPGTGKVLAKYWDNACADASSNTDFSADYRVSDQSIQCSLYIQNPW